MEASSRVCGRATSSDSSTLWPSRRTWTASLTALQWSDLSVAESEEFGATVGALLGLGLAGEEGMEAGADAGAEAGADGHVIDESEVWDIADTIEPERLPPSR